MKCSRKLTATAAIVVAGFAINVAAIANVSDYKFGTIAIPSGGAGTMAYTLGVSNRNPPISETGTASFSIVGVLTIPNNITSDWFGGYKSSAPHSVQFDDFVDN